MLTKMMGGGGGAAVTPATSVYTAEDFMSGSTDRHEYTSAPIGTADATRIVIVGIFLDDSSETVPSSVTIGPYSASKIGTTNTLTDGAHEYSINFYGVAVPTGTIATIIVNYASGVIYTGMIVYALYNSTITPTDQDNQSALDLANESSLSHSITVPNNGTIIAVAQANDSSLSTDEINYTVLTEDVNLFDSGDDVLYSGAHLDYLTGADPQAFLFRNDSGPTINAIQSTALSFPAA